MFIDFKGFRSLGFLLFCIKFAFQDKANPSGQTRKMFESTKYSIKLLLNHVHNSRHPSNFKTCILTHALHFGLHGLTTLVLTLANEHICGKKFIMDRGLSI